MDRIYSNKGRSRTPRQIVGKTNTYFFMKKIFFIAISLSLSLTGCSNDDSKTDEKKSLLARSEEHRLEYPGIVDQVDYEALLKDDPNANIDAIHEAMVDVLLNGDNSNNRGITKCPSKVWGQGIMEHTIIYDFGFAWCLKRKTYSIFWYIGSNGHDYPGVLSPDQSAGIFDLGCSC